MIPDLDRMHHIDLERTRESIALGITERRLRLSVSRIMVDALREYAGDSVVRAMKPLKKSVKNALTAAGVEHDECRVDLSFGMYRLRVLAGGVSTDITTGFYDDPTVILDRCERSMLQYEKQAELIPELERLYSELDAAVASYNAAVDQFLRAVRPFRASLDYVIESHD